MLLALFLAFLTLRLFTSVPFRLPADSLKFLELAKNFPYHTLYNSQVYLQHPPVYPYLLHFFNLILSKDYIAGIFMSLLFASLTFYVLYRFLMLITADFSLSFTLLLLFSLSVELIDSSHRATRESLMILLLFSSIYFYIKSVRLKSSSSMVLASLSGAMTALTTDHVIFLFPAFGLSYLFFNKEKLRFKNFRFPGLMIALVPVLITLLAYGSWLGARAYVYSGNEFYPAGLEGTPVRVNNFGLFELINPTYFGDYEENVGVQHDFVSRLKNYAYNLGYMLNIEPFSIPRGLNFSTASYLLLPKHVLYMIVVYFPLAIIAVYGFFSIVKDSIKKRKLHTNAALFSIALLLIFMFPITQRVTSPRYLYPAYPFLFFVISYGVIKIGKLGFIQKNENRIPHIIVFLLLILIPAWLINNHNFVLFNEKVVVANKTADFIIKKIPPGDSIMAQPGYGAAITYLTDNKVIGLPPKPDSMLFFIKHYNIKYAVFGRFFTYENYHYSVESVDFIKKNPDKFQLIASIKEDYGNLFSEKDNTRTDEVYIYRVKD